MFLAQGSGFAGLAPPPKGRRAPTPALLALSGFGVPINKRAAQLARRARGFGDALTGTAFDPNANLSYSDPTQGQYDSTNIDTPMPSSDPAGGSASVGYDPNAGTNPGNAGYDLGVSGLTDPTTGSSWYDPNAGTPGDSTDPLGLDPNAATDPGFTDYTGSNDPNAGSGFNWTSQDTSAAINAAGGVLGGILNWAGAGSGGSPSPTITAQPGAQPVAQQPGQQGRPPIYQAPAPAVPQSAGASMLTSPAAILVMLAAAGGAVWLLSRHKATAS